MTARHILMGALRYVDRSHNRKCPQNVFFCFLQAFEYEISKAFISRELYIILNGLTFQNEEKTHLAISF